MRKYGCKTFGSVVVGHSREQRLGLNGLSLRRRLSYKILLRSSWSNFVPLILDQATSNFLTTASAPQNVFVRLLFTIKVLERGTKFRWPNVFYWKKNTGIDYYEIKHKIEFGGKKLEYGDLLTGWEERWLSSGSLLTFGLFKGEKKTSQKKLEQQKWAG